MCVCVGVCVFTKAKLNAALCLKKHSCSSTVLLPSTVYLQIWLRRIQYRHPGMLPCVTEVKVAESTGSTGRQVLNDVLGQHSGVENVESVSEDCTLFQQLRKVQRADLQQTWLRVVVKILFKEHWNCSFLTELFPLKNFSFYICL